MMMMMMMMILQHTVSYIHMHVFIAYVWAGEGRAGCPRPLRFFPYFNKGIYFLMYMLNFSVAVHSSLAEYRYVNYVPMSWQRHNYKNILPKIVIFEFFLYFSNLLKQNCTICLILHSINILPFFCINFSCLLSFSDLLRKW